MSWFGIGIIKDWEEENKRLQEMITNLLDQYELLEEKAISLEQEVIRLIKEENDGRQQMESLPGREVQGIKEEE